MFAAARGGPPCVRQDRSQRMQQCLSANLQQHRRRLLDVMSAEGAEQNPRNDIALPGDQDPGEIKQSVAQSIRCNQPDSFVAAVPTRIDFSATHSGLSTLGGHGEVSPPWTDLKEGNTIA